MKKIFLLFISILLASCTTLNISNNPAEASNSKTSNKENDISCLISYYESQDYYPHLVLDIVDNVIELYSNCTYVFNLNGCIDRDDFNIVCNNDKVKIKIPDNIYTPYFQLKLEDTSIDNELVKITCCGKEYELYLKAMELSAFNTNLYTVDMICEKGIDDYNHTTFVVYFQNDFTKWSITFSDIYSKEYFPNDELIGGEIYKITYYYSKLNLETWNYFDAFPCPSPIAEHIKTVEKRFDCVIKKVTLNNKDLAYYFKGCESDDDKIYPLPIHIKYYQSQDGTYKSDIDFGKEYYAAMSADLTDNNIYALYDYNPLG